MMRAGVLRRDRADHCVRSAVHSPPVLAGRTSRAGQKHRQANEEPALQRNVNQNPRHNANTNLGQTYSRLELVPSLR